MAVRLKLTGGLEWLDSIPESERTKVFTALFALCDGSAFLTYGVFKVGGGPGRFLLTVASELAIRVRIDWARSEFELLGFTRRTVRWPRELDTL
ncbi:DUF6235 family protein [Amycolatopsis decaplanina]|uniref:Uncharacterized protein n=1 Tax=Amycolatopsis decaplanina DSM 44594 TaxID=1284240 RepID=M2ZBL2_9PSEU|nr:DUF6235 family protein [Amycolatopsis decaplanina]EME64727.1 hypothetical protein H074_02287 [Amycolatopsis decaplanina DSM 44594]